MTLLNLLEYDSTPLVDVLIWTKLQLRHVIKPFEPVKQMDEITILHEGQYLLARLEQLYDDAVVARSSFELGSEYFAEAFSVTDVPEVIQGFWAARSQAINNDKGRFMCQKMVFN